MMFQILCIMEDMININLLYSLNVMNNIFHDILYLNLIYIYYIVPMAYYLWILFALGTTLQVDDRIRF